MPWAYGMQPVHIYPRAIRAYFTLTMPESSAILSAGAGSYDDSAGLASPLSVGCYSGGRRPRHQISACSAK